jgi:hypothetical protein
VLLVGAAVPSSSFDTASLDRQSTIGVVTDTGALLGIDQQATVNKNTEDTLVVITNRFAEERTISVALGTCTANELTFETTGAASDGVRQSNDGTEVIFHLPADGSQEIRITVNEPSCDPILTRITTTDGLTEVAAERESSPAQGNGGNGNGGNGNGGNGNSGNGNNGTGNGGNGNGGNGTGPPQVRSGVP